MQISYIANACFLIRLAGGQTLLTDPWFEGPCQQTWWNFPPVPAALAQRVRQSRPDLIYMSHLHHDHLHGQSLEGFDRRTPVLIGKMNTPNLRKALHRLGFFNLIEQTFETVFDLPGADCRAVLFRDFHATTAGDDSLVEYDLDTSLYLFDSDGTKVFNAVDNTILAADAARLKADWGAPDLAILPYASASLFPMGMRDYSDAQKIAARDAVCARAAQRFAGIAEALGAPTVIAAGGEYVLGGPVADQSLFLPQPLEGELSAALAAEGRGDIAVLKLYPGDAVRTGQPPAVLRDPAALFRDFTHAERADYALTLADQAPGYAAVAPEGLEPDWERLLTRAAKLYLARCAKAGYAPALDLTLHVVGYEDRAVRFSFTVRLDDGTMGFDLAVGAETRSKASYTVDERLLFCLITGLLNWNAMEASGLLGLSRTPDVYDPDLHRLIVHFNLLA